MSRFGSKIFSEYKGINRQDRLLPAIYSDYVKVDDRNLDELLLMLNKISRFVTYYNSNNEKDGNWSYFFKSDSAVLLAKIINFDFEKIESEWLSLVGDIKQENTLLEQKEAITSILDFIYTLFRLIDKWYVLSINIRDVSENRLNDNLYYTIKQKLASALQGLFNINASLGNEFTSFKKSDFHNIWELDNRDLTSSYDFDVNQSMSENVELFNLFQILYEDLFQTYSYIISISRRLFDFTLNENQSHGPHMSMIIAFLKLFGVVQGELNEFTSKHLNYYYSKVLKEDYLSSNPDKVHLSFDLDPNLRYYDLEKGALLLADSNQEGRDNYYELSHDLRVSSTRISTLMTMFLSKNQLYSYNDKLKTVDQIYSKIISEETLEEAIFSPFGESQYNKTENDRSMMEADIGFAISSPILALSGGDREIDFIFKFDLRSMTTLIDVLDHVVQTNKVSLERAFIDLFKGSVRIYLSTNEAWYRVDRFQFLPPVDWLTGEIVLKLKLDRFVPSISTFPENEYGFRQPALKLYLGNENAMYPYSLFSDLILEQVDIKVNVKGLKKLDVYNEFGKIDSAQPFNPFGATPHIGSYMMIANTELYKKDIKDLKIHTEWSELPTDLQGFKGHYKSYGQEINNNSFQLKFSALSNFQFLPLFEDDRFVFSMFETKKRIEGLEVLSKSSTFHIRNFSDLNIQKLYNLEDDLDDYSNDSRSGFLKFELVEPSMAFGLDLYPELYSERVTAKAKTSFFSFLRRKKKEEDSDKLNKPYIPVAKNISIDYTAKKTLFFHDQKVVHNDPKSEEKLLHISPFGFKKIYDKGRVLSKSLVESFAGDGYLYLGLKDAKELETLSFYFELEKNTSRVSTEQEIIIDWEFLYENEWVELKSDHVLYDSTKSFSQSGIIMLKLPQYLDFQTSLLPKGLFWISARARGRVSILSKLIHVAINGAEAQWLGSNEGDSEDEWTHSIPADTIQSFKDLIPEISNVNQAFSSFGGQKMEDEEQFLARVSERLRHKNRSITVWDYERLVLSKFHFVQQVKCLRYNDVPDLIDKGDVALVVVPRLDAEDDNLKPVFNKALLSEIQESFKGISSIFSSIFVLNPLYEELKIAAKLVFRDSNKVGGDLYRLTNDINRFLCPWLYTNESMNIGGSLSLETLLRFIETRPYIEFVTGFSVIHIVQDADYKYSKYDSANPNNESAFIQASSPASVLVPSSIHDFEVLDKRIHEIPTESSIEKMNFDVDFIVDDDESYFNTNKTKDVNDRNSDSDEDDFDELTILL